MLGVLFGTVAPVFAIVLLGAWLRSRGVLDPASLSRLTLYALSPALVFSSLAGSHVTASEFGRVALAVTLLMAALYAAGLLVGRLGGLPPRTQSSYLLATVFMNSGNYGLPIMLFAFGETGLAIGVLYFVAQAFMVNTVGAYTASRGKAAPAEALVNALRVPTLWAGLLALPFLLAQTSPPSIMLRPIELLGRAAVPLLLLVLGASLDVRARSLPSVASRSALVTRLALSPMLAVGLAWVFGLRGETAAVFVVESGMPTAVTTVLLSMEFDADTDFLSSVIAYSTLLSVLTLPVLIPLTRAVYL